MKHLTRAPIDLVSLVSAVQSAERGGIACFVGTVRNHHEGREVSRLEYSAYESMVEAECERILHEARSHWPAEVAVTHRLGPLSIGDASVAIAAASAHRAEAFAACRFVIEEVKRRLPIWKKEFFADGSVSWVDPTSADQRNRSGPDRRAVGQPDRRGAGRET